MGLKEIWLKQGGRKLLKQYWQSGAFFTAVGELLLLGKSRTALEILRLSARLKTRRSLEKQYREKLEEFEKACDPSLSHLSSDKVWICWFQGIDNAPELVQRCYKSLVDNLTDREIVLITSGNMMDYAAFPDYILKLWKRGSITDTHMTDLLRLELLIRHGGMWVDATVFCSRKRQDIPAYYFDSDLFLYQCLRPGREGHSSYISSWLISARSNNRLLMAVRHLLYTYWKEHREMIDYFLFHNFMSIVLDYYPEEWKRIVPCDNATPHILLLRLFDEYDENIWNAVKAQTPFHKLSYKNSEGDREKQGTYYKQILR